MTAADHLYNPGDLYGSRGADETIIGYGCRTCHYRQDHLPEGADWTELLPASAHPGYAEERCADNPCACCGESQACQDARGDE